MHLEQIDGIGDRFAIERDPRTSDFRACIRRGLSLSGLRQVRLVFGSPVDLTRAAYEDDGFRRYKAQESIPDDYDATLSALAKYLEIEEVVLRQAE
jgi:hypothetical protein